MKTAWNSISGIVQGDITYTFRATALSNSDADFTMIAYSEKWDKLDISFEFRAKKEETWRKDAFLTISNANKIDGNRVIGLDASKYGAINIIRWSFTKNAITYGENIEVRVNILPRIKQFSTSRTSHIASQVYGRQWASVDAISNNAKILNINNDGKYIMADNSVIYIRESPDGENLLFKGGFDRPMHVIQMANRNYLIADYGGNRIVEVDEELNALASPKSMAIDSPVFFDYNERNETILITRKELDVIEEYTWRDDNFGSFFWQSWFPLSSPESASYKVDNCDQIVVADSNNNRIVLVDRVYGTTNYIDKFRFYETESSDVELLNFYKPFRVFWSDETVYIIEKEGRILTFEDNMSTSSSMSTSSESSSQSSISSGSSSSPSSISSGSSLSSESSLIANIGNGLQIYYKFNEGSGTTITDYSGNANDGTISGSGTPSWITGLFGSALKAASGYIRVDSGSAVDLTGDWTCSWWLMPALLSGSGIHDATGPYFGAISYGVVAVCDGPFGGTTRVLINHAPSSHITTITDGSPYAPRHMVATYNSATQTINVYLDGNFVTTHNDTAFSSNDTMMIEPQQGLDELAIWNRVLSLSEISYIYNGGSGNEL